MKSNDLRISDWSSCVCSSDLDETPQPAHRGRAIRRAIISRSRDYRKRHHPRDPPPVAPAEKLGEIAAAHQPDETVVGVAPRQSRERIDGVPRAEPNLDVRRPDRRVAAHRPRRGEPDGERRPATTGLWRVAARDQPPTQTGTTSVVKKG